MVAPAPAPATVVVLSVHPFADVGDLLFVPYNL